jgi:hypothetical protein
MIMGEAGYGTGSSVANAFESGITGNDAAALERRCGDGHDLKDYWLSLCLITKRRCRLKDLNLPCRLRSRYDGRRG